jgi:nucleotide-binding universal stress UspA family protein
MFSPKNILVATDFTQESDHSLREAVGISKQYGSRIFLLHVVEDITQCAVDYCMSEAEFKAEKNRLNAEFYQRMDDQIKRVIPGSAVEIIKEVRYGSALDEIVDDEREKNIDLVITAPHKSAHRWGLFKHQLTNNLVKKSICETMVVR